MEQASSVGKQALKYRLIMNEGIGVIISLAITALVGIILTISKFQYTIPVVILLFVVVLVVQFVILYFISIMQYKALKYIVGQNAISFQRGALGVERENIPFEKIKNSTFDQSFFQRFFSVGDITIDLDDEKYIWEDIDSETATLISNAVSAKGDVQPITVATAAAVVSTPPAQPPTPPTQ